MAANMSKRRNFSELTEGTSKRQRLCEMTSGRLGNPQSTLALETKDEDAEVIEDTPFSYSPLESRQIRLLRLHPGQRDEPIRCSLLTASLDSLSSYEALSYVWGSDAPVKDVLLSHEDADGVIGPSYRAKIRRNLFSALTNLRLADRPLILWADALCTNQDDYEERSSQVGMMGDIYRNAHEVFIWLGETSAASNDLTSTLSQFFRAQQSVHGSQTIRSSAAETLIDLCSRKYWNRAWVFQEVALAQRSSIICGDQQVTLEDFRTAIDLIAQNYNTGSSHRSVPRTLMRVQRFLSIAARAFQRSGDGQPVAPTTSLQDLLLAQLDSECSNPRDRVYALLGLAREAVPILQPDYSRSVVQVYCDAAQYLVESSNNLDMILQPWIPRSEIEMAQQTLNPDRTAHWPSWLPDWRDRSLDEDNDSCRYSFMPLRVWDDDGVPCHRPLYHASGTLHADISFGRLAKRKPRRLIRKTRSINEQTKIPEPTQAETSPQVLNVQNLSNRVLMADGIEIATVTDFSTRIADGLVSRDSLEMAGMNFASGCEALETTPPKVWERVWRTLVADRDSSGRRAPSTFGFAFNSIFKKILNRRSLDATEMLGVTQTEIVTQFLRRTRDVTRNRRLFQSSVNLYGESLLGLAPKRIHLGDRIVILFGCSVPVLIRPSPTYGDGYWRIVGPTFVYGKMDGEALSALDEGTLEQQTKVFEIV